MVRNGEPVSCLGVGKTRRCGAAGNGREGWNGAEERGTRFFIRSGGKCEVAKTRKSDRE
jgi:hypothetical protein